MHYEIQFARITNSGKLPDRFLSCQHLESKDLTKTSMGEIFTLIEILSPWFPSAQIGQAIINNFVNTYFQGGSTSDLVNFENSLKKVNENLAQITQNGETDWIGNLNGILVAIVEDNLHLSPTGKSEAYIFREGKINHLTHGLTDTTELHPLKIFTNIVSGQLKPHDKILVTNKTLFNFLSLESVRQIIILNTPAVAALEISKLLRKAKTRNVNLIIINLLSKEESSKEIIRDLDNVYYLDKSTESFGGKIKQLGTALSPIAKIISLGLLKIFASAIQKISSIFNQKFSKGKKETSSIATDKFENEFIAKDARDDHLLKDEEIKYSPDFYVHYYQEKKAEKEKKNRLKNFTARFLKICRSFALWLVNIARDRNKNRFANLVTHFVHNKRKFLYIALALIFILIIGLVIGLRGKNSNVGNLEAQRILDEAIAAQKEAKNSLLAGNQEKAKEKFILAIEKAQNISKNPLVTKDAEGVLTTSYQELDKLTSTTRFNKLKPIVTLSDNAKGFFITSGETFIITETDVYEATLLGGNPQKIATLPKNKGSFVAGTNLNNILYLYTSNQNLFELEPSSGKLSQTKIAEDGRWETANALSSYVGSIYLLDGIVGQIYKHSSDKETFSKGEEYTTNNSNLKQTVSFAIDGAIFVLKKDGQAVKYQRSKLQDFSLKNIPTPWNKISGPKKIYTDSDTPSLYVLDTTQKRILEFDKDGFYIRQYALPSNFEKISDFNVSVKSKKIWILNENSIYEISI